MMGFCSLAVWFDFNCKAPNKNAEQPGWGVKQSWAGTMTDGNSKKSKVSFYLIFKILCWNSTKLWSCLLLLPLGRRWFFIFLSPFDVMKLSWSKKMVRKLFNIKSKAEDFQADEVVYAGECVQLVRPNQQLTVWFAKWQNITLKCFSPRTYLFLKCVKLWISPYNQELPCDSIFSSFVLTPWFPYIQAAKLNFELASQEESRATSRKAEQVLFPFTYLSFAPGNCLLLNHVIHTLWSSEKFSKSAEHVRRRRMNLDNPRIIDVQNHRYMFHCHHLLASSLQWCMTKYSS